MNEAPATKTTTELTGRAVRVCGRLVDLRRAKDVGILFSNQLWAGVQAARFSGLVRAEMNFVM